jgi:hypothetical protein
MPQDHRKYIRIAKPLDATWAGAAGGSICRIADISWGGCFVQARAQPAIRERTEIVARIGDRDITFSGSVVYVEPPFGFSIEFDPLTEEQISVMKELLGEPPASAS